MRGLRQKQPPAYDSSIPEKQVLPPSEQQAPDEKTPEYYKFQLKLSKSARDRGCTAVTQGNYSIARREFSNANKFYCGIPEHLRPTFDNLSLPQGHPPPDKWLKLSGMDNAGIQKFFEKQPTTPLQRKPKLTKSNNDIIIACHDLVTKAREARNLGIATFKRGEYNKAKLYFSQAAEFYFEIINIRKKINDINIKAKNRGFNLQKLNQLNTAITQLERGSLPALQWRFLSNMDDAALKKELVLFVNPQPMDHSWHHPLDRIKDLLSKIFNCKDSVAKEQIEPHVKELTLHIFNFKLLNSIYIDGVDLISIREERIREISEGITQFIQNHNEYFDTKSSVHDLLRLAAAAYKTNGWNKQMNKPLVSKPEIIKKLYAYGFSGKHIALILAEEDAIQTMIAKNDVSAANAGILSTPNVEIITDLREAGISELDITEAFKLSPSAQQSIKYNQTFAGKVNEIAASAQEQKNKISEIKSKLLSTHIEVFEGGIKPNADSVKTNHKKDLPRAENIFLDGKLIAQVPPNNTTLLNLTDPIDIVKVVLVDQNIRTLFTGAFIPNLSSNGFNYSATAEKVKYFFKNIQSDGKSVTVQALAKGKDGGVIEAELKFDSSKLVELAKNNFKKSFGDCLSSVTIFSARGLRCKKDGDILEDRIILPELIEKPLVANRELVTAAATK